ncbi:MAG: c-type cytochrome [Casimicrobiaceae bacterium]
MSAKPRAAAPDQPASPAGEAIYLDGVLSSGTPLIATRPDSAPLAGERAACVGCHRRSGLGEKEARSTIPPITGRFLFQAPGGDNEAEQLPYIPGARPDREPYTEATLARAIREGIDSQGRPLSYLMPRFALDDADMAALIAHLRALDRRNVPGVSPTELHFATIIAPDADPVKRRAMLGVLQQFFADRNAAPRGQSAQTMSTSGNTNYVRSMFKVNRHWNLHMWQLTGPPAGWAGQLDRNFAEQPVFAVISGLAGQDWSPVSAFCERRAVPCLFPNVDEPPGDADRDFHSLYFTRGVLLEADLIAANLGDAPVSLGEPAASPAPSRVRIVHRSGDVGSAAAHSLTATLRARGVAVLTSVIPRTAPGTSVAEAVRHSASGETLVLWLRPPDLAALEGVAAPPNSLYLSGLMAGLDASPLPAAWRVHAHMAYPADLPERRRVRVDYALSWFRIRKIPVEAEQIQVDTYLACGLLTETMKHMGDAFIPDYLVERLEDTVEHRIVTGYYPRLALGPHQRFASKGGYLVHYAGAGADGTAGPRLVPDGDWTTP